MNPLFIYLLASINFVVGQSVLSPSCSAYSIAAPGEQCGNVNGKRCSDGSCCSQWGWCGTTAANCDTGCQLGYGNCWSTALPVCPGGSVATTSQVATSSSKLVSSTASPTTQVASSTVSAASGTSTPCANYPVASPGGSCGSANGYRCPDGSCCSQWGFCGAGSASYCGTGCQLGYGQCWTNLQPSCGSVSTLVTSTKVASTSVVASSSSKAVSSSSSKIVSSSSSKVASSSSSKVVSSSSAVVSSTKATTTAVASSSSTKVASSSVVASSSSTKAVSSSAVVSSSTKVVSSSSSVAPSSSPLASSSTKAVSTSVVPTSSAVQSSTKATNTIVPTDAWSGPQIGSYFTQWGVYGRNYKMIKVHQSGQASRLTFINYAFGNVYKQADGTYKCGILNKAEPGASNPSAPDAGTGGDAWADFGMGYTVSDSVDGIADTWDAPLAGNFGQFRRLKRMYPNLKIMISLGGWTWSKWFSAASATDASRKTLVSSCIDLYIKGNLPVIDGRGGPGSAIGVFDGIDIDWEYPGGGGQPYNTFASDDHLRYTALLQEFRTQLDAYGSTTGKHYGLTVAIGSGGDKIQNTDPNLYYPYIDWVNIMSYDYHGGWEPQGPTDFQSHLYNNPAGPNQSGWGPSYNLNSSVVTLISKGMPANKICMGVPFYGRGWTGVANTNNGLYQPATGPAPGTYEAGIEDYKVLVNAGGSEYYSSITHQSWKYIPGSSTFWSYDTPAVIREKAQYGLSLGLKGIFSWSLDGDSGNVLTDAMTSFNGGVVNPPVSSSTSATGITTKVSTTGAATTGVSTSGAVTTTQQASSTQVVASGTASACLAYPTAAPGEQCGTATGKRCSSGCCSQWGYCGTADANCGTGCQLGYGLCTSNQQPVCPGGSVVTSASQVATSSQSAVTTQVASSSVASTALPTTSVVSASLKPVISYAPTPSNYPSASQLDTQAQALAAGSPSLNLIRNALRTLPDVQVEAVAPGLSTNPDNVKRVERVCSPATFDSIFPVRHIAYTYTNLLKGVAKFPAYCDTYTDGRDSDAICRKLLATSFAHMVQETGANWPSLTPATAKTYADHNNTVLSTMNPSTSIPLYNQGLWFLRESGYQEGSTTGAYQDCYTGPSSSIFSIFFPCSPNAAGSYIDYFGRGSKQLSWNYNFGGLSKSLYNDANVLLDNPGKVADTWLNFASAVWFAVTPQSPKPPMTWAVDGTWVPNSVDQANNMSPGFGSTIWIINGGIECGSGTESQQATNRINAYKNLAPLLGVTIPATEMLGCATSKGFQTGSAAGTTTYLDKDWGYNAANPGGASFACKLVQYQTPFTMASTSDYASCVDYFFRGQVYYKGQLQINNAV